jgi:hypothetical protein
MGTGLTLGACKTPTGGHGSGGGNGGGNGGGGTNVASVTVTPPTACLAAGQTVQLMATTKDSAGDVLTGHVVGWASGNVPVASVDQNGLVTGVAQGSATITATSQGHSGTAGIALQTGTATASLRSVRFHFALGDGGAMLQSNGANWNPVCSGTTSDLHAIIRNGLGTLFVAGAGGTILQYDTTSAGWRTQPSGTTSTLYGLARAPAAFLGTLFAVGAGGTILAYDGSKWSAQSSGTTSTLFSVGKVPGLPADFAVGAGGTILHYDGTSWSAQPSGTTSDLYVVAVLDSANVYALGAGGTVVHYDGTRWSLIAISGLTATLRAADVAVDTTGTVTDYFVVGDGGTILHSSDGVTWSPQPSGTTNDLFAVAVATDSNAVAVGALGTILRYDGTSWSKQR